MAAQGAFQYDPRISTLLDQFLPENVKFQVIALFEKRDRDLEDYIAKLEARVTAGGL